MAKKPRSKQRKPYRGKGWAGFYAGKIVSTFETRRAALWYYEDVRRIEIRELPKPKRK